MNMGIRKKHENGPVMELLVAVVTCEIRNALCVNHPFMQMDHV